MVFRGDPPGEAPEDYDQLRDALARRGIDPEEAGDPYAVMAELVEHERRVGLEQTTGLLVLLLVEPRKSEEARRLAAAASAYTPHVVLWSFDPLETPRLRAYSRPEEVEEDAAVVEPASRTGPEGGPRLRLTGLDDREGATDGAEGATSENHHRRNEANEAEDGRSVGGLAALSEDELDMLLAEDGEG